MEPTIEIQAEIPANRWRAIAGVSLAITGLLLASLLYVILRPRLTDERLIGTWQSDADRTIAVMRESRTVDAKQEAALRRLFGRMRLTFTPTKVLTELDGPLSTDDYEVLGRDNSSVVIRVLGRSHPEMAILEQSEFTLIHFDGLDAWWVDVELMVGTREYFKRVK